MIDFSFTCPYCWEQQFKLVDPSVNNQSFIEVMNQSLQLDPIGKDKFGSEGAGLELTFDTEKESMEFKQGPYKIKMSKE